MFVEQTVFHQICHLMNNDVAVIFFIKVIPLLPLVFRVERKLFSRLVRALLVASVSKSHIQACLSSKKSCGFFMPVFPY